MAQFNADINLDVKVNNALAAVSKIEKAIDRINSQAEVNVNIRVNKIKEAEKAAAGLFEQLERIENAALSKLPTSLQTVIAFLKAANAGLGEFSKRAILASAAVGDIGRVNFSPIVRQLNQVKDILFEIEQVRVQFLDRATNFRPRFDGGEQKLLEATRALTLYRKEWGLVSAAIEEVNVKFLNFATSFRSRLPAPPNPLEGVNQKLIEGTRALTVYRRQWGLVSAAIEEVNVKFLNFATSFRSRLPAPPNPLEGINQKLIEGTRALTVYRRQWELVSLAVEQARIKVTELTKIPNRALPPADFNFLGNPNTLRGLRNLRSQLQDLLETAVIGSRQFRALEDAVADVDVRINNAQLLGQSGGVIIDKNKLKGGAVLIEEEKLKNSKEKEIQTTRNLNTAEQELENKRQQRDRERLRRVKEFDDALKRSAEAQIKDNERIIKSLARRGKAVISGGLTGAGFPALFGASQGEIAGGGIGGIIGGLAAGSGGAFAGSIIGSALGQLAEASSVVENLAKDLGFAEDQTQELTKAFEQAGLKGADAFKSAVTALSSTGLSLEDQVNGIRAATALSKQYGGNIDKVAKAFADTLNTGKVSLSSLNKLQSQGIPIQQTLADKLGITRTELIKLAQDGELKVQDLADAFTELARKAEETPRKAKGGFDDLSTSLVTLGKNVVSLANTILQTLAPAIQKIIQLATQGINSINSLFQAGNIGAAQRALTIQKFLEPLTFGTTDGAVQKLASSLSTLSADSITTAADLKKLEDVVANYQRRVKEFKGEAGSLSERLIQPELRRLINEINTARNRIESGQTTPPKIEDVTAPFQAEPPGGTSGGSAPESQALALQAQISQELARQVDIKTRFLSLQLDEVDALNLQNKRLKTKESFELGALELERQQALANNDFPGDEALINRLFDLRSQSLQGQTIEQQAQNRERIKAINLERELQKLQNTQSLANQRRGLESELGTLKRLPTGNQFKDESVELEIRQQERLTAEVVNREQQIARLRLRQEKFPQDKNTQTEINKLEKEIKLYKELLPQISAAEQAQLKFNQALSLVQGPVDAFVGGLVSGLQDVIAGTKSAEEAFADFLSGIANALIQTASTLIAQYIAIGIARKFAGLPPASTGTSPGDFNLNGFGNLTGPTPGFADGGRPPVGETSIVGERGPELFVPDSAGTVLPNEFFQAAQAALLKPGTLAATEEGDPNQAFFNQNRNAISNVTNTVNNRASTSVSEGPTTTMTSPMTDSTIRFESMMIGNMEVVTKDEAEEIGQRSAAAARASVFNDLQNKPSIRRKLGMS